MKQRMLGRTNLEVSEIGFGAWAIGGSWGTQKEGWLDAVELIYNIFEKEPAAELLPVASGLLVRGTVVCVGNAIEKPAPAPSMP